MNDCEPDEAEKQKEAEGAEQGSKGSQGLRILTPHMSELQEEGLGWALLIILYLWETPTAAHI